MTVPALRLSSDSALSITTDVLVLAVSQSKDGPVLLSGIEEFETIGASLSAIGMTGAVDEVRRLPPIGGAAKSIALVGLGNLGRALLKYRGFRSRRFRIVAIFDNDPQYPFHRDLFAELAVIDYGDCRLDYGNHQKAPATIEREAARILRSGATLVSLGGDHFVTWPLLKAHAAIHGPLALVQFDAHQDTWFDDGRRIDHGSFVARAVRDGVIDPEWSIQIGVRTHAPEDFGIRILYGHELEEMRVSDIVYAIRERTAGRKVYITFDVDCLDPAFAPGTGTPVAGGPSSAKMLSVLRALGDLDIVGADIVEVAPAYDHADITAIAGASVAMHYLGLLSERKAKKDAASES